MCTYSAHVSRFSSSLWSPTQAEPFTWMHVTRPFCLIGFFTSNDDFLLSYWEELKYVSFSLLPISKMLKHTRWLMHILIWCDSLMYWDCGEWVCDGGKYCFPGVCSDTLFIFLSFFDVQWRTWENLSLNCVFFCTEYVKLWSCEHLHELYSCVRVWWGGGAIWVLCLSFSFCTEPASHRALL